VTAARWRTATHWYSAVGASLPSNASVVEEAVDPAVFFERRLHVGPSRPSGATTPRLALARPCSYSTRDPARVLNRAAPRRGTVAVPLGVTLVKPVPHSYPTTAPSDRRGDDHHPDCPPASDPRPASRPTRVRALTAGAFF